MVKNNGNNKNGLWKPILLISLIVIILILSRILGLGQKLAVAKDWIQGLGAPGYLVFVLLYIGATIASIPGSALTVIAGALFGSVMGLILVSIGSTIGAGVAFLISRYFARDATARWLHDNEKFKKLDNLTEKHGAIIVAITRLIPIFPFNLLNYGFGLTKVHFSTFIFWSWLCMLPGTALYVVGADAFTKGIAQGRIPWVLILTGVVILLVLILLANLARKSLNKKERQLKSNSGRQND